MRVVWRVITRYKRCKRGLIRVNTRGQCGSIRKSKGGVIALKRANQAVL
jgi:hypothetical protein